MSQDLITKKFKRLNSTNLNRNIASESSNDHYYLFIGKSNSNETANIDDPIESEYSDEYIHREMIAMKKLSNNSFSPIVERRKWVTDNIYDEYSDKVDLSNLNFYVINSTNGPGVSGGNVYICLNNNNGGRSTIAPTHDDNSPGGTTASLADGYVWEWLYGIPNNNIFDEANGDYMPVINGLTSSEPGIVKCIIKDGGYGYGPAGEYACPIVGDHIQEGSAIVTLKNSSIVDVRVSNAGRGFTFANIDLRPAYSQENEAPIKEAIIEPIIAPKGGFGYDNVNILRSELLMIVSELHEDENSKFPINSSEGIPFTYGQIGIIRNPINELSGDILNVEAAKCLTELTLGSISENWSPKSGDLVIGSDSGANGIVSYWDQPNSVLGIVQQSEVGRGLDLNKRMSGFSANEPINIDIDSATITSISAPEYKIYSGDILYVANIANTARAAQQKERIKVILDF